MLKNLKYKIKKNLQILGLIFLIIITIILTSYFNFKKNMSNETYNNFIDNIYFKKTLNQIIENLEPKYKNITHNGKDYVLDKSDFCDDKIPDQYYKKWGICDSYVPETDVKFRIASNATPPEAHIYDRIHLVGYMAGDGPAADDFMVHNALPLLEGGMTYQEGIAQGHMRLHMENLMMGLTRNDIEYQQLHASATAYLLRYGVIDALKLKGLLETIRQRASMA